MSKFGNLVKQGLQFVGISGIGWLLDFGVYTLLGFTGLNSGICNVISSLCGVTFVFFFATRKTFEVKTERFGIKQKYVIYVLYQLVLIAIASKCVALINGGLENSQIELLVKFSRILAKILVTPFTMVCNFFFMKFLTEKI